MLRRSEVRVAEGRTCKRGSPLMADVVVLAPPPILVSVGWGLGDCNLELSSIHRLIPAQAAGVDGPSLRLHRELHIRRFLSDGRPWDYEIVDLPDHVCDAGRIFFSPSHAGAVFADLVRATEYGGLPNEALEHVIGTAMLYVRDIAAWAVLSEAGALSTDVWADVHVHVRVVLPEEETTAGDDYYGGGEHLPSPPTSTAVWMTESRDTDRRLPGDRVEIRTECGEEKEEEEEGKDCCAICLEGIAAGDGRRRWLPCSHSFHGNCIGRWLLQKAECPLCRFQVVDQDCPNLEC